MQTMHCICCNASGQILHICNMHADLCKEKYRDAAAPLDACVCCNPDSRFLTLNCIGYHLSSLHEFTATPWSSSSSSWGRRWWWRQLQWWCCWWHPLSSQQPLRELWKQCTDEVFSSCALAHKPELNTSCGFEMMYFCIVLLFIWWHRIVLKCIATYFPSWVENSQIFEMMYHGVKHVLRKSPKYWGWYITGSISTYATKFHAMCVISTWAVLHCIKRHMRHITYRWHAKHQSENNESSESFEHCEPSKIGYFILIQ